MTTTARLGVLTAMSLAAAGVAFGQPAVGAGPPSPAQVSTAINAAALDPKAPAASRDALIRVETLLDRAHFSPGVIDGRDGSNLHAALGAFEAARGIPGDGQLSPAAWDALTAADKAPATVVYTVTAADVAGPFLGKTPTDMAEMAKLKHMDFDSAAQKLAERFHMDQALLIALNPGVDFKTAGAVIVVAAPGVAPLSAPVTRVEVDKAHQQVRAFDAAGKLAAAYPATVGSQERPAPSGVWAVTVVAPNPDYTFDPARLTFGKSKTKLTIAPGPNNPVGSTWIGLTKATYGIHGTPDPTLVGKVASHGCVRMTNWDARQLGAAVKPGTKVEFVGEATRKKTAA
jgi:lipoprotein-anchoring transpeptidase ErfK/SrfK